MADKSPPIPPFSYVGQGSKAAKVKTKAGIAAKELKERKENEPQMNADGRRFSSGLRSHGWGDKNKLGGNSALLLLGFNRA
jgi:hypothetical protein